MFKRLIGVITAVSILAALCGCTAKNDEKTTAEVQQKMSQSFQTTAKVIYRDLETVMTIYKKPMNCAEVTFVSPESLKDMKMVFYTDRVTVRYKEMAFDFIPDSLPGKAASKLVIDALNAAMSDSGIRVDQNQEGQFIVSGRMKEGDFSLVLDAKNGNILKLSIPDSELEMEVLNFKILE